MNSTAKFDFPVQLSPVKTNNVVIPNKVAVFRSDTKQPIGVVSDKYALVPHKDVIEGLREALDDQKYEENISLIKEGAHMFAKYKIPGIEVEVAKGDMVALQIIARNSYDGRKSFQLMLGAYRIVCSNGMIIGREFFKFTQRHVEAGVKFGPELLKERIEELVSNFKGSLPAMKEMTKTKITIPVDELFNPEKITLPEYLVKAAQAEYERAKDSTQWGFYNSLTSAVSHNMRKESPKAQIKFLQVSWELAQGTLK